MAGNSVHRAMSAKMLKASSMDEFGEMALLIRSYQFSKMLEVVAAIGLTDRLDQVPRPAKELASECGADEGMLLRLCRALAAFGVFAVDAAGNISHTSKSRWLRSDANPTLYYAVRYWCMPSMWATWGNLELAIRTGRAPFEAVHGMPYFEFMKRHKTDDDLFNSFMQHSPEDQHAAVAEAYNFSDAHVVVDVGGGNGALLAAILSANPGLEGILFDQEGVVASAHEALGDLAERCKIWQGDFFDTIPAGGDVYTLSRILHDWNDEQCHRVLVNIHAAIKPGGRLLVIDRILDDEGNLFNPMSFLSDMHMMALFPGAKERTLSEFSKLFNEAGFAEPKVIPTRSSLCIVETKVVK